MASSDEQTPHRGLLPPFLCVLACALLWPALITFDIGDWPSPNQFPHNNPTANACGPVGAWLAYYFRYYLGDGAYPLLLFATLASVTRLVQGRVGQAIERAFGMTLVVLSTAASVHLVSPGGADVLPVGAGGIAGYALGELLIRNLSQLGTMIVLGSSFFIGMVFATQGWVLKLPSMLRTIGERVLSLISFIWRFDGLARKKKAAATGPARSKASSVAVRANGRSVTAEESHEDEGEEYEDDGEYEEEEYEDEEAEEETRKAAEIAQPVEPVKRPFNPIVRHAVQRKPQSSAEPYPRQLENWTLPPLTLLEEPEYDFTAEQESFVRDQARILERTLEEFRLDAQVVEIDTGPVITMFELRLGAGIKVSQIASLSNDIARALKAHAIRVVAPITGKNTVGIEVPNARKETVRLKELMTISGPRFSKMQLPLFLGKDAGGEALVADLAKMPHLLIAGTTGSGKSVCINSIILSLLMTKQPDRVKMILIDPKMVEMSQFKEVPHLMCPIVTDMPKAEKILEWAVTKMDERYELLAEARVRNIATYNELGADKLYERMEPANDHEKSLIPTYLPYIVIVIDELADLMMTSAKEVEHHLSRLAQKSRAVGIHIIVATQRPEAKVVTGLIKSNLPCRIAFRVASRMDSRIVLDQNGGEVLMGQGDMLFLPPGQHKLMRAQGTYLEDAEIAGVLDYLIDMGKPEFHPELIRMKTPDAPGEDGPIDPLFNKAVDVIVESQRGSVSLLQRRLTIGYSRASRLIDQMAAAGIVGEYKGSQAREVVVTPDEWAQMRAASDDDAAFNDDYDDDSAFQDEDATALAD